MPPIHVRESFQASLFDQALTSFYSWYPSVLSLYRKSLMPVIWVEYIAPSNMLRIDHSIFISKLFSHILHNTAFRGVGLMNQLWFFVDNCEGMLHPDPSLHCAASWLHLTHEEDSTILSCIENTSAPISASDLRYESNSVCFLAYIFDSCSSMRCVVAWTSSRL